VVEAAEGRGDARYALLGRLVRAGARARLGHPVDGDRLDDDLDRLAQVAALEGWWLAAELADATGSRHARDVAERLVALVAREAADREGAFRKVAAARLG